WLQSKLRRPTDGYSRCTRICDSRFSALHWASVRLRRSLALLVSEPTARIEAISAIATMVMATRISTRVKPRARVRAVRRSATDDLESPESIGGNLRNQFSPQKLHHVRRLDQVASEFKIARTVGTAHLHVGADIPAP